jgi:predicted ATPase/DNA-binding XRE family transcriptional regulator
MKPQSTTAFGDLLRDHRFAAGLTQEELAERAGLSVYGIQKLERGVTHPYRDTARRLARALELTPEDGEMFHAAVRPVRRHGRSRADGQLHSGGPQPALTMAGTAAQAAAGRVHTVPEPLTSFVGREPELTELHDRLQKCRLVTLTGVGGIGKTRLAMELTRGVARNGGAVGFVELAPVTDAVLVPHIVAASLGISEQPGRRLLDTLLYSLRPQRLLILLDNCEHLIDACAELAHALLSACPFLRILATSREPLGIAGETTWQVAPLSLPHPGKVGLVEELAQYHAVQLFLDRATAALPTFTLTEHDCAAVAQICDRLDGIPLALELAAPQLRIMSARQLAERLDDRFRLLVGGNRAALPRHQRLQAAVDWSYDLLSEAERRLFNRLSVFAGGWSLEAAEAVCSGGEIEREAVLGLLGRLVDKSLVLAEQNDATARFRLLETLRQYGRERLSKTGDSEAIQRQHAAFFVMLAEQLKSSLKTNRETSAIQQLTTELPNIRVALNWACDSTDGDLASGLLLAVSLCDFWQIAGHVSEARAWLDEALKRKGVVEPHVRAKALTAAGELAAAGGDLVAAVRYCQSSLEAFRASGDPSGVAQSLHVLAWSVACRAQSDADYTSAADMLRECLAIEIKLDNRLGEARALHESGELARLQGAYDSARAQLKKAHDIREELGDTEGVAWSAHCLAWVELERGDWRAAKLWADEALRRWELLNGDSSAQACATLTLRARILCGSGDLRSATEDLDQSLRLWRMIRQTEWLIYKTEWLIYSLRALAGLVIACHPGPDAARQAGRLLGVAEALHDDAATPLHSLRESRELWARLSQFLDSRTLQEVRSDRARWSSEDAHAYAESVANQLAYDVGSSVSSRTPAVDSRFLS